MLRRPLGVFTRTLGLAGTLALKVGAVRKALLILCAIAAFMLLGLSLMAWALFGG